MMAGMPPATEAPNSMCWPFSFGQRGKLRTALGNEQLVGGDHGFSGAQRLANPFARGRDAANQFHDDVSVRGENFADVLRPVDIRQPVDFFALHIAIENVRQDEGAAGSWLMSLATALPTVPKPSSATLSLRPATG